MKALAVMAFGIGVGFAWNYSVLIGWLVPWALAKFLGTQMLPGVQFQAAAALTAWQLLTNIDKVCKAYKEINN